MAPVLELGFQARVTEVRLTSVTSGLDGELGIRFGSVGRAGCTATPNSEAEGEEGGEENLLACLKNKKQEIYGKRAQAFTRGV